MSPLTKSGLKRRARISQKSSAKGLLDRRSTLFHAAGLKLLASADYENVSIAMIAKEAGSSVGAFYYRYPDKAAFLRRLISETFRGLEKEYERKFFNAQASKFRDEINLSEFISHILDVLGRPGSIGVIRASLKLGTIDSDALGKFSEYRSRITADADKLFSRGKFASNRIREAMQLVFAAVVDAVQMPDSVELKVGSAKIRTALCEMLAAYLSAPPDFAVRGNRNVQPSESISQANHRAWKEGQKTQNELGPIEPEKKQTKKVNRSLARRKLI